MRFLVASSGSRISSAGDAALSVRGRQQRLGDDALERAGEHDPDLLLLLGREDVDDPVDRARARSGCAACRARGGRSRRRSARSRSSRGRASRRRGSRRGPGGARPRSASPKLVASAPISRWLTMHRLWRCTNSIGSSIVRMWSVRLRLTSSIIAASVVDLPEPVGPVTSTSPRGCIASAASVERQAELLERLQLLRDDAEGGAERAALEVDVDAEAGEAGNRVRGVDLALDLELLLLLGREHAVEQLLRDVRGQRRNALEALELAADANRGRRPHRQVEVGRAARDHCLEQLVDRAQREDGGRDAAHVCAIGTASGVT